MGLPPSLVPQTYAPQETTINSFLHDLPELFHANKYMSINTFKYLPFNLTIYLKDLSRSAHGNTFFLMAI